MSKLSLACFVPDFSVVVAGEPCASKVFQSLLIRLDHPGGESCLEICV
jgi:hypothetical protein